MGWSDKRRRLLERNKQLEDDNKRLRSMLLQNEDNRTGSIEVEVQRRLASATEDFNNEVRHLLAQHVREKEQTKAEIAQLQKELSETQHARDGLSIWSRKIATINLRQRQDDCCKANTRKQIAAQQDSKMELQEKEIEDLKKEIQDLEEALTTKDHNFQIVRDALLEVYTEKDLLQTTLNNCNSQKGELQAALNDVNVEKWRLQATLNDAINNAQSVARKAAASLDQAQINLVEEKNKRNKLKDWAGDLEERVKELSVECEKSKTTNRKSFWGRRNLKF